MYIEKENVFMASKFDLLKLTNNEIISKYYSGISDIIDYNYLLNKFGFNLIDIKANSWINIFIDKFFFTPTYYYMVNITHNKSHIKYHYKLFV